MSEVEEFDRRLAELVPGHLLLQQVCALCVRQLAITGAGVSVISGAGQRGVVCATDDGSSQIEALQFELREGPCVDAVEGGRPVLVADLQQRAGTGGRWPGFEDGAAAAGVRAVFAFPLTIGAITLGCLDLYRSEPGPLSAAQTAAALSAAGTAAGGLLHLSTSGSGSFTDRLPDRSAYHLQTHQATGMIMVQMELPVGDAFRVLCARAFACGRPVADVADDVVSGRLRFSVEDS